LELPALELDQRVRKELEENPVLETKDNEDETEDNELSLSEYYGGRRFHPLLPIIHKSPIYKILPRDFPTFSVKESFRQNLEAQLGFRTLTDRERKVALFLS